MSLYLVPAIVELTPLNGMTARLYVVGTNGRRARWDGPQQEVRRCEMAMLEAMSARTRIDLSLWPGMQVDTELEWDE